MKLRRLLFAAALLTPVTAFAHPGDHSVMTAAQVVHHLVTSPDHLAQIAMAATIMGGLFVRARRRSAR